MKTPSIVERDVMRRFTRKELACYDGRDGKPIYVGYKGKVYDLSNSFLWRDGKHQVVHRAGADLTEALKQAPHSEEFIKKFPVVGVLVNYSNEPYKS